MKAWLRRRFPDLYQTLRFLRRRHHWPDRNRPATLNEELFRLKMAGTTEHRALADKLAVRPYIQTIAAEQRMDLRLPEILTVFESPEALANCTLAEECFIKANHGSGMTLLHPPTLRLDAATLATLGRWFSVDYADLSGERCYQGIVPRLFLERPLRCRDGTLPLDVKIHCFFGQPRIIQVLRRDRGFLERKTFDEHGREQHWFEGETLDIDSSSFPREEALRYARVLSAPFPYVRVDFYNVDDVLYFSELTFFPASSALPLVSRAVDRHLGALYRACAPACASSTS